MPVPANLGTRAEEQAEEEGSGDGEAQEQDREQESLSRSRKTRRRSSNVSRRRTMSSGRIMGRGRRKYEEEQ